MHRLLSEFLGTGRVSRLDELKSREDVRCLQLFRAVHGFGAASALAAFRWGARSLEDLERWPELAPVQRIGLRYHAETSQRLARKEARRSAHAR